MPGNVSMIPGDVGGGTPPIMGAGGGSRSVGSASPEGGMDMYKTMMMMKMIQDMSKKKADSKGGDTGGGLGSMLGGKGGGAGGNAGNVPIESAGALTM